MSIKISSSIWSLRGIPPTFKLIILKLSDNANDAGSCWPSIKNISEECELSERTIQYAILWAEKHGLISREMRSGKRTIYNITPAKYAPRKICTPADYDITPPQITTCTPADYDITHIEPSKENRKEEAAEEKPKEALCPNDLIEAFEDSVCSVWGEAYRRLCPNGKDRMVAGDWIEHGITPDFCRDYFKREMAGLKDRGKDPPKGLSFFNSTIAPAFAKDQSANKFEKNKTEDERRADYFRETGKWLQHWGTMPEGLKNVS